jgi:hypothetical protein
MFKHRGVIVRKKKKEKNKAVQVPTLLWHQNNKTLKKKLAF